MAVLDVLEELGLSEAEARVYLALLETGSTTTGPVIKISGLHRATAYQILQRLMQKGLVSSVIKGKKRHFEAANPERLLDVLKERQERLAQALPSLRASYRESKEKQEVTVYAGTRGIRSVLDRMLEELTGGGEYCDFGVSGLFRQVMGAYWDYWQKQKKRRKIKSYVIFNEGLVRREPQLLKDYSGECRFHPSKYSSITDTMVYNDTTVLFIWTGKPPIAVVIKNRDNAKSYRNQFDLMWKNAKK